VITLGNKKWKWAQDEIDRCLVTFSRVVSETYEQMLWGSWRLSEHVKMVWRVAEDDTTNGQTSLFSSVTL